MIKRWARRLLKIALFGLLGIILLLSVGITLTIGWRPFIGPRTRATTDRRFEPTPERRERGRYLAEGVVSCIGCHSNYDESTTDELPPLIGKIGAGRIFTDEGGFRLTAPNITPDKETGIGAWSDDEVARAIREGVNREGRALFPVMPYMSFKQMSDEDLASIIVYIRTLEPVRNGLPQTQLPFPLSRIINNLPEPINGTVPPPDLSTPVKRGEHLILLADCAGCHTPRDSRGQVFPGYELSGGNIFGNEGRTIAAANITPDPSGISYYDEALFLEAMRTGHVKARKLRNFMPWWVYRNMTDDDLKAMFAYLRTVKPASHRIDNQEKPTLCRICKQMHGLGDKN